MFFALAVILIWVSEY